MNAIDWQAHLRVYVAGFSTQRDAAAKLGITPQRLSDLLSGRRTPTERVLKVLGLQRVMLYMKVQN
jgi:plasmid maintenance system antidote protein VapI